MNCEEALEALWPPERPRVAGDKVIMAREHVESCFHCQEFLEKDRALRRVLGSVTLPKAPPEVRERVFEALAAERARRGRPGTGGRASPQEYFSAPNLLRGLGMAAAVTALVVVGSYLTGSPDAPPDSSPAASVHESFPTPQGEVDHFVRFAVQEKRMITSDPGQVIRFLAREIGIFFEPVRIQGFDLLGVEVCVTDEKRGAVVLYERNGQVLYHYLLQNDDASAREPEPSEARPLRWSASDPPSVVTWSGETVEEALVGNLSSDDLLALVRQALKDGGSGIRAGSTEAPGR